MELVPIAKGWSIGAWHIQQWTHTSKDFSHWYELARTESGAGRKAGAYIAADLAAKLLDGGGFLVYPVKVDAEKWRDQHFEKADWTKEIQKTFPEDKIIYAATLFVKSGAGVLLRFGIPAEKSANALKEHCAKSLALAVKAPWGQIIDGIRCAYNLPSEDPNKDGVLGGMFMGKDKPDVRLP